MKFYFRCFNYLIVLFIALMLSSCQTLKGKTGKMRSLSAEQWLSEDISKGKRIACLDYSVIDLSVNENLLVSLDNNEFVIVGKMSDIYTIVIRAVYSNIGGIYRVYENDDNTLTVYYGSLGSQAEEYHKAALKIEVKKIPKAIYIHCTTIS